MSSKWPGVKDKTALLYLAYARRGGEEYDHLSMHKLSTKLHFCGYTLVNAAWLLSFQLKYFKRKTNPIFWKFLADGSRDWNGALRRNPIGLKYSFKKIQQNESSQIF